MARNPLALWVGLLPVHYWERVRRQVRKGLQCVKFGSGQGQRGSLVPNRTYTETVTEWNLIIEEDNRYEELGDCQLERKLNERDQ